MPPFEPIMGLPLWMILLAVVLIIGGIRDITRTALSRWALVAFGGLQLVTGLLMVLGQKGGGDDIGVLRPYPLVLSFGCPAVWPLVSSTSGILPREGSQVVMD